MNDYLLTRRWPMPVATFILALLGTAALAVGLTMYFIPSDEGADQADVPALSGIAEAPEGPVAKLAASAWVSRAADATGIRERALAAYAGASIKAASSHPGCGLGWNTLAAIGQVESEHGGLGRSVMDESGLVLPSVIGVPLDGDGVAKMRDSDNGQLDEDVRWDRAVGPMQFIPTTWKQFSSDGDEDGESNVHDIDDAALSAASYLCSGGRDLSQPDQWTAAVKAYNPDSSYANQVAEDATRYMKAVREGS